MLSYVGHNYNYLPKKNLESQSGINARFLEQKSA